MYFSFKKQYKYHPGDWQVQETAWWPVVWIITYSWTSTAQSLYVIVCVIARQEKLKSSDNENEEEEDEEEGEKGENVDDRPLQSQDMFATDKEEEERPIESQNIFDDFDSEESQSLLVPKGD